MTTSTQTVSVPHLGGISASYMTSGPIDHSKPTLVLVNSFTTSAELYRDALSNSALTSKMNLLAIELLGHGQTRAKTEHWTYWDTAIMNLQVMEKLGVERAFALGTSQGGWVVARMALLSPEKISGILPLGTSLDTESPRSRSLGCWDALDSLQHLITTDFTSNTQSSSTFTPPSSFADFLISSGFGPNCPQAMKEFWTEQLKKNYEGEEGRKRIRMAAINLRDRDGLHLRAGDIKCPVLWLHGTDDAVYSVANAQEEIKLFTGSENARLEVIQGGQHFLSASNPEEVFGYVTEFVGKYAK
ncbi:Alpha/Beta hydrolase protein [Phaeosphaeria sp. MPI-PUGE-AT-0046c]|nr:Alpha/Beta hydrolase protein [Phaeosphaeria sp. MPI-PUGE-AT-0046c]